MPTELTETTGLAALERAIDDAYEGELALPGREQFYGYCGGKLYACGLTAAYLGAGNDLPDPGRDDLIEDWAVRVFGLRGGEASNFMAGYDGTEAVHDGFQEAFRLGQRLAARWEPKEIVPD